MEVNNQENSKEKSKLSFFLIVWSAFNMIMGALLFAIPALTYSILFRKGQYEFRIKAIVFNQCGINNCRFIRMDLYNNLYN